MFCIFWTTKQVLHPLIEWTRASGFWRLCLFDCNQMQCCRGSDCNQIFHESCSFEVWVTFNEELLFYCSPFLITASLALRSTLPAFKALRVKSTAFKTSANFPFEVQQLPRLVRYIFSFEGRMASVVFLLAWITQFRLLQLFSSVVRHFSALEFLQL